MHLTFALFFLLSFSSVSSSIVVYEGKVTNSVKKHRERERKGTLLSKSAKYQTAIVVSSFLPAFGIIRKRKKKKKKEGENTTHCGFSCVDEHESQKVQGGGKESALHQLSFLMLCSFCIISSSCLASTTVAWPPFSAVQKQNGKINRKRKQQQQQLSLFLTLLLSPLFSLSHNSVAAASFLRLTLK